MIFLFEDEIRLFVFLIAVKSINLGNYAFMFRMKSRKWKKSWFVLKNRALYTHKSSKDI